MRERGLLGFLVGMEIEKILVRPKSFLLIWRQTRLILLLSSHLLFFFFENQDSNILLA